MTFYSVGKVTSLLGEKIVFSVIASKSLKSSLFGIFRTRLKLKAWSPYKSQGYHKDRKHVFANRFCTYALVFT